MNWANKRLEELGTIVTGKTPATKNPNYYGGEFMFVTPRDLEYDNYYVTITNSSVTSKARDSYRNQFIPRNSVMFTCIGNTIGKSGISSADCLTNQQINSIVVNRDNNPKFVYYLLAKYRTVIRSIGMSGGAATPIINKSTFSKVKLQVPDKKMQNDIADILSAYDDLIENNRRRIALLEDAARLLYREWFVHFRFPGHERVKIVDGLPKGWMVKSVGDLAEIKGGKHLVKTLIRKVGPVPVYGGNGIQGYTDNKNYDGFVIVFGRVGANCGSVHWSYDGAWINNNASGLMPNEHPELLLHHLLNCKFANYRKGAAQPFIPNGVLSTIRFVTPPENLASMFCKYERTFRLQQVNLNKQNQKLCQARNFLLPRLMNGQITI